RTEVKSTHACLACRDCAEFLRFRPKSNCLKESSHKGAPEIYVTGRSLAQLAVGEWQQMPIQFRVRQESPPG
ncbi:hypothetical protein RUM43_007721, partial [Polyplax serrata]